MTQESDKTNQGISMLKNCLRTLFVFLIPLLSVAQSGPLTYEDFVHLSEKEKDRFVLKTMELMVRLENNHRNDPRTLEMTQDEEKKFTLFINQLKKQFFIPEAYAYPGNAQADAEWKKAANDFKDLITKDSNEKKCVFAGWISKAKGEGKNTTCSHPGFLEKKHPEAKAYIAPSVVSPCGLAGPKMIQCNPVIFGYKSIKNKTPFCVEAENMARNASFDCMQAARDLDANNKGDSKADRLNYLKDRLTENKNVFKDVHEFNYKMCVCKTKPIPDNFSEDYLNLIQLHQTCYGIMMMIGEVANSCNVASPAILPANMNLSIFENLKNHISKASQNEKDPIKNRYGFWYKDYIEKLRKNPTPEYARLCDGKAVPPQPEPKPWTCSGKCKIEGDKLNCDLSVTKPDGTLIPPKTYPFSKSEFIGADNKLSEGKNIEIKVEENSGKKLICSVDIEGPKPDPKPDNNWPKYTCNAICTPTAPPMKNGKLCKYKVEKQPNFVQTKLEVIDEKETFVPAGGKLEVTIEEAPGKPLVCAQTDAPPKPEPEKKKKTYTCEASCVAENEPEEGGKRCQLTITSKDDSDKEEEKTEEKIFTKDEPLEFRPKDAEKPVKCDEKKSDDPSNDTNPTLNVTATEKDERSYNVKAVKTNDEGWSFGWVVKASSGTETPNVSKDWEDKTGTPPAGTSNDGSAPTTPSAKTDFVQQRAKVDFNICGQLKKGDETIEKCATIKKYVEKDKPVTNPTLPSGPGNVPAPPQPIIRNSSDTGAVGVR